jgi:hypothetical protein
MNYFRSNEVSISSKERAPAGGVGRVCFVEAVEAEAFGVLPEALPAAPNENHFSKPPAAPSPDIASGGGACCGMPCGGGPWALIGIAPCIIAGGIPPGRDGGGPPEPA